MKYLCLKILDHFTVCHIKMLFRYYVFFMIKTCIALLDTYNKVQFTVQINKPSRSFFKERPRVNYVIRTHVYARGHMHVFTRGRS